jgi:hypothetical protein
MVEVARPKAVSSGFFRTGGLNQSCREIMQGMWIVDVVKMMSDERRTAARLDAGNGDVQGPLYRCKIKKATYVLHLKCS